MPSWSNVKRTAYGCLVVLLGAALGVSIFFNFSLLFALGSTGSGLSSTNDIEMEKTVLRGGGHDQIGVVPLLGVIGYSVPGEATDSMVDDLVEQLTRLRNDDRVKAVIVRIDSPGGEVTASDVIYHAIKETDAVKPVVVYMDSVAASGGYYAAVGGRHLIAHETSITGSIGVIMQAFNFKDLTEKIGVSALTIKSGAMKDLLNPFRDTTPEEIQFVQSLIDETYDRFVGIVATERELEEQTLRDTVADGRILSGSRALEAGLIDATGYFDDAVAKAEELAGIKDATLIRLQAAFSLSSLGRLFGAQARTDRSLQIHLSPAPLVLEPGKLYYLSPHLWNR
jgi:protease IV